MEKEKYTEILNQVYERLHKHKKTRAWATFVDENLDMEEENSVRKSNHRLVVTDIQDIADSIFWILELLDSTDLNIDSFDIRGQARLKLLFQLLLQEFTNLCNRSKKSKQGGDTDALKKYQTDLIQIFGMKMDNGTPDLNEVAEYRDLMIVHAQTRLSRLSFSADPQSPELRISGTNLLNTEEETELSALYLKYFPEGEADTLQFLKPEQLYRKSRELINGNKDKETIKRLVKRSGTISPSLSELTMLLDKISKALLKEEVFM